MDKHNIWLLVDSSKSGGIESHVAQLAQGLQQHGEQVEVVFLRNYGKHPMRDLLALQGIKIRTLDGGFKTLLKTLKQQRPRVLHTHGYKAGILVRLAALLSNIPTISTYHAGEVASGKLAFYDWIDRMTAGFADKIFAVSPQIAKRLPVQADIFNNFVNNANLNDSSGDQIAFVGRVSHEKGPDYFISLASVFPDTDFHMYGDGPLLPALLKKQLTDSKQFKNLHLHGQQDDMDKVWPNIGLLVITSRFEGLPMAALEAMARGIPVLAFNVGALNRLIVPECNGWLISSGDMNQLVKQINLWNSFDRQHKEFMALACKSTIKQQFCSEVAIPKLLSNYQQVVHASR